jgi:phosphoadenosine phosphosulfate reductase
MTLDERVEQARLLIREQLAQGGLPCVTSSFQAECVALVHLLVNEKPDVPVLFLDTGYHFDETYTYRDFITESMRLNLVNLRAQRSVGEQEAEHGRLYESAPDRCCGFRKVEPLFAGLAEFDVWFTALRREQSPTRANLEHVESFKLPSGKTLRKISPLALWSNKEVWQYLKQNGIPVLPLYDAGYTSIGCRPCTSLPIDPENLRSGRWGGRQKLECGIHIQAQ